MTDQLPKPTGLSKPTVPSGDDDFFNQDFSRYGMPEKDLEIGGKDIAVGLAGSSMKALGTGIAETSMGGLARGARGIADGTLAKGIADFVANKVNPDGTGLLDGMASFSPEIQEAQKSDPVDGAASKVGNAIGDAAEWVGDKADKVIQPATKTIGSALKSGGESVIKNGTSADYQEAVGRELYTGNSLSTLKLGSSAGDAAVWAAKMVDGIGSIGGTVAAGALTGGTVSSLVKRQMLKRGASEELARETARLAGIKWGQRGAVAAGVNMSTGQAAEQARAQVNALSWDQLTQSQTFMDQARQIAADPEFAGKSATEILDEAKRRTGDHAASIAMSDPKTWAAAAAGTVLGDAALFKMLQGVGAKGAIKGLVQGAAGEATGEAIEEGTQQYVGNEATNKAGGQQIDPWDGVAQAAATAGTIGAFTGGITGTIGGARGRYAPQSTEGQPTPSDPSVAPPDGQSDLSAQPEADQQAGNANPLGPSSSAIDEIRDTPAFLRQDGTADRFKGWADANSDVQRALAGEFGPTVEQLIRDQIEGGNQGKTLRERVLAGELGVDPFAGNKSALQVGIENAPLGLPHKDVIFAGDANAKQPGTEVAPPGAFDDKQAGTGPQFRGAERTRWQDGQEGDVLPPEVGGNPAGALPGRVIEGEAREVGTELPYRDVVYGQDGRPAQQAAAARNQAVSAQNEQLKNAPKAIGQTDTIFAPGAPGADNKNSAYTPPRLSRDQVDTSLGEQSIRDPRTHAGKAIQQAGSEADSIFGPLKSLRITRKGKPFATEKEAVMASRKGQEMPVPLNGGGFGVAAIDEVQQAQAKQGTVKQPSSNSAQQDRQDGKTEIAQNGMVIVHGSGNPGMSEQDIQIVRASGQKQGKKGRVYGGFYGTSEQDAHQAQAYADMMGGTPTLYDVKIKPGTKVLHKQGDITRLSESYINELVSQGYGVVTGTDPRGQTEHVVIDKSAVASMAPRGTQSTPSQVDEINVADMRQPSDQPAKNVSADTVPAPSATAGKASQNQSIRQADQTVKSIDPAKQEPTAPVINEGTKQPEADNAAMPQQLPKTEPVQQQTRESSMPPTDGMAPEQNTAPAPDAGVSVSGSPRFTIEPLTDKSIIVKGDKNDAELKEKVEAAWPKAKPLYNERLKGWVFGSKREGVVREALSDLVHGDVAEQKLPANHNEVASGSRIHTGTKATAHTPSGKPVDVQYRLAEASDLTASHDFDGSVNPLFPQELQPRDRSRAAARQQLFNIAQQPAPDRLTLSAETDRGAPITKDGVVESGNGRVIGLTEAYRRGNAESYRQYLADHASDFGFTKEQIQGMKQPILVRERLTDMSADERRAFTVDSNKGASLSLGATEQAMADANGMDDAMLAKLMIGEGGDVLAASNEAFLNDFATMLGNNELGTYKTQTGEWTSAYRQRVMNAIFAKGYGNSDLLSNIAESANPEVRNLLNGLMNNAGKLATLRGIDAESGARLASVYSEAANLIGKSRRDKQSIQELNSQGDMLGGGASQEAKDLAAFIDTNMRSGKSISSILGNIANKLIESAKNRHQADIFSGDAHQSVTVGEAINAEISERNTNQAKQPKPGNDLFGANPARLNTKEPTSMEGATARSAGGIGSGSRKQGVAAPEAAKIADFGQKIGGARKDVWSSYRDSIEGATAEQIAELPLSKAWPAPDYQKLIDSGVDARAVGLMRAARDAIPSKPRTGYKVKSWASAVKELRDLSMGLLDGSLDADVVGRMMERSSLRSANNIINRAELYQAVGHQRSLADLTLEVGEYSMKDGVHYSPPKKIWSMSREGSSTAFGNWPRMFITGDTKEQVIAEFKKRYDQLTSEQTKPKSVSFDIYSNDSRASWIVGKKAGRNYIPLSAPFESLADARRYREENHDALVAELEKRKAIPNERRDINQPRVGEDMRSGADVTPEMFTNAFGFRGVEFGNWVGNERRQRDLNDAYDALMDMAAVLGIHPKALSLNGELGMAFGARGSGGVTPAAAHYEPGKVVINLTKMNGAGSLGHEWWHALDNYFSRQRGAKDGMMTTARDVSLASRGLKFILQGGRQEMIEAFGAVKQAIDKTALKVRSSKLDSKRTKDYWTTDVEMSARAFESYLISKLQDQGVSNDYLANIIDEETWDSASKLGFELDSSYPYPTAGEIPGIRAGFDHLFNTIEEKVDGDKVALFSKSDSKSGTKGMDKADIEQVAKEWLEQYKGAAGVRVLVGNNQAEINEVLQMVGADIPGDGQTINAVYLPGYNTLLLNAETIPTAERARELMRHEVLVHHGLRAVVGDDLYITILEAVKRGERIAGIKDAYYQVASNYADMHQDKQAEEVFAHWAENQPERGELHLWWRSVVRKVKDALRAVGLLGPKTTEDELNRVLDAIVTGMRNGRQPGRRVMESWHDAPAYSMRMDPFKPDTFDARAFADEVDAVYRSGTSPRHQLRIGDTPSIYVRLGAKNHELVMPASVVKKATNPADRSHNVAIEDIKRLPQLLSDPLAVIKSATENNALVSLVEALDMNNKPVIVAIHMDAKGDGFSEVNKVASVYGKDEVAALQRLLDNNLVYLNKEKAAWFHAAGLQLPGANYHGGLSKSVLTKDDIRNSDALFSLSSATADQSILGQAESLAKAAPSTALNWLKEMRPKGLGALTDLQIDQIYREITGGAISMYQKLRTKMEADRNEILLDAETRIDPLWDALGKEQKKALSNLMHDATMAKLHPDLSLADNSLYQEAKERLDKAIKPETKAKYQSELDTITANHKHLAERYNLGLNNEGKALYQTMRETYDKQWADLRDAIEHRLEDLMGADGKTLAAELRLQMESALKHGPYFPLARFGDYVVKATKGDEHIREHFERRKDAEQAIKQYQRDGYNAVMTVKEAGTGGQANSNALGMKVMQLLDEADSKGGSASSIKDDVWQAMLQMLPDASFAKHAIHRRRVKGASRDGHRAYLNSVYHYAHHVSKIRYGHKMQGELNKMNEQIQAGVKGEQSNIKPEDLEVAQQLLNEMNMRHELNMNPKGARWTGWAGNLGFMWYMAGSPASAIINMTQNFTVMLPQLGAKYGFIKAGQYMVKAMFDYVKHGKFKAGTKEAWQSLTRAESGLTADEKAMLNTLYKAGVLDLTQAHSIAARADTDLQEVKPGAAWQRKTMAWAGSLFHNAEVLNREVAALAAYRLLKEQSPNLTAEQYADQVTEMIYDGHGNYAASNRPRYMRGNVAKVMTQFKIYSQLMTYTLYRNAYLAAKGDRVALKTLGGILGTHFVMAGVMGLPYPVTMAVYAIASAFDDDDDREGEASFRLGLTEVLGKDLGELVARGPMDAMTGLSIAGRTGINGLWYRDPEPGAEGDDLAWHITQQIIGPVPGIFTQALRGLSMMGDGDYQRGAETMMPKALKDVAKAYRQASEGERTRKGDIIIDDVDAFNVAMQVMGFSNAEMAKAYDARKYIKGKEGRIEDERSRLLSDYFMARKSGDEDEMADVMARIREFNNTHHRKEAITGRTIRQSVKSKMRSGDRTQGGVYLSKKREYLRAEGAFADTGE